MLTQADIKNIRVLLNRVTTNGVEEAKVLLMLAHKLDTILAPGPEEAPEAPAGE